MSLSPPNTLGAPSRFGAWRPEQEDAVLRHLTSDKRFVASNLPTGAGKSLMYVMAAELGGERTCILTSTKGLQAQLLRDFHAMGLTNISGMNAYGCVGLSEGRFGDARHASCDDGPCLYGMRCELKDKGCLYFDQYRRAKDARLVVTNYAYWLSIVNRGKGLGQFDRLVLDEAHDASEWVCSYLTVELETADLHALSAPDPGDTDDVAKWAGWAAGEYERILENLEREQERLREGGAFASRDQRREVRWLRETASKLDTMRTMGRDWVMEQTAGGVKFAAVWPTPYCEDLLFKGVRHVDLVSATILPKTLEMLGIGEGDYEFQDYPSSFPLARRPIIHVPTVRVNHRTTDADMRQWLNRIDQIIRGRQDRKGIIHSVSFQRARFILEHSEFRDQMYWHTAGTTRSVVERFREASAPVVLVSPSVTTGWDFPFDQCEYQIIGKIPFPDTSGKVMKARGESDPRYSAFTAALILVQMVGRGMRDAADRCETLVIDDNVKWFLPQNSDFFPVWFKAAYRTGRSIPVPPPSLQDDIPF